MKKHRKHFLRQILVPSSTSSVASAVGMSVASAEAAAPLIPAVDAIGYEAEHIYSSVHLITRLST